MRDQQAFNQIAQPVTAAPACARSYPPPADLAAILTR